MFGHKQPEVLIFIDSKPITFSLIVKYIANICRYSTKIFIYKLFRNKKYFYYKVKLQKTIFYKYFQHV